MTVTTSWELFEDLRSAQDEMLRMTRRHGWQPGQQYDGTSSATAWAPAVEISERKDAYLVAVDLPGVKTDDAEITFEDGLLTIHGQRHMATEADRDKVHRSERCYGAFRRAITLPSHVQPDKIAASAQDGVLQVVIPKAKEVQAKRIQVRASQSQAAVTSRGAAKNGS